MDDKRHIFLKQWGNSQGIMISKNILEKIGITDFKYQELTLEVKDQELVIRKNDNTSRLMAQFHDLLEEKSKVNSFEYNWGQPRGNEIF